MKDGQPLTGDAHAIGAKIGFGMGGRIGHGQALQHGGFPIKIEKHLHLV
jgi:hypothetical protein